MDISFIFELTWQAWLTLTVIAACFGALALSKLPADFVLPGGLIILLTAGVLSTSQSLHGFSSPGLATVGLLYVVVAGLQETGALFWISRRVLGHPSGVRKAQLRLMLTVSLLSAFLNNTPVVAMFIPTVRKWALQIRVCPSQLLIPLSYASIMGGLLTMIGTSTNLVVNSLVMARFHNHGIQMFEIALLGLPCAITGVIYIVLFGKRLLPERDFNAGNFDNPREYTAEMLVTGSGGLSGKTVEQAGLAHLAGGMLIEIVRNSMVLSVVRPEDTIGAGDRLIFAGTAELIKELRNIHGLIPASTRLFALDTPGHQRRLVEAVVSSTCPLLGTPIAEGKFREYYNAAVLAVSRNGQRVSGPVGEVKLQAGDAVLIEAHAGFVPRQRDSRDFYLISGVADSTPVNHRKALPALIVLAAMVAAVASSLSSMLQAVAVAAVLLTGFRCVTFSRARKNIEWNVLVVIGAALGLGMCLETSGAATVLSGGILHLVGSNPWVVLATVYLMTSFATEFITNNGAAALIFPIALGAAEQLAVSPMPFVMCLMVGASASFSTPIGYQTNLMVYGPGGYRFSDYLRIGVPLSLVIGIVAVATAPLIWPFQGGG